MKKDLLETIDETIQAICGSIQKSLNEIETSGYYPSDTIKALAELLLARALIDIAHRQPYSESDSSASKE